MSFYYPILKKGNAEIKALEESLKQKSDISTEMLPIIEAPQKADPNKWEQTFKTFGSYLKRKISGLEFAFQYSTAFSTLPNNPEIGWKSSDGKNIIEYMHDRLSNGCSGYTPCFNYDDPDWITGSIPQQDIEKIIVRIEPHKFESGLDEIVVNGIKTKFENNFSDKRIIWLLDFYKDFSDVKRISSLVSLFLKTTKEENIVFGATSCPEDANSVSHSQFSVATSRDDLKTFLNLRSKFSKISFADYTVRLKPDPSLVQKKDMNMNNTYLKIFYTTKNTYMIAKSGLIKNQKNDPSHLTIQETCKLLIQSPFYSGSSYSWGDKKINECALGLFEINDHQVPIQIGINHHIFITLDQL